MSFVFDGGFAAEAGVDAVAVVEVFDPGGETPLALECDPPAHHRFAQLSIPGHRRDSWTLYPTPDSPHHDDTPVSNDDEFP